MHENNGVSKNYSPTTLILEKKWHQFLQSLRLSSSQPPTFHYAFISSKVLTVF